MAYEQRTEPPEYSQLAEEAKRIYVENAVIDPGIARAKALRHVVDNCEMTIEEDTLFLGGENPFFFNLMLPALHADGHGREGQRPPDEASQRLREASVYMAACFEGHITPGLDDIISQGVTGIRWRVEDRLAALHLTQRRTPEPFTSFKDGLVRDFPQQTEASGDRSKKFFWEAALLSCDSLLEYARRCREKAVRLSDTIQNPERAEELRRAAAILSRVPEHPAETLQEALQSYWLAYILVTLEMGGCCPGGGLGLGRLDQFLYPYYARDLREGRLTRAEALELMELFLLCFRHIDYYTPHQFATPGSQASIGGVTPAGLDASNDLTELIMEASLRIAMPAPYVSLRLHRTAPERYWEAAANYVAGGLGFSVVNDEVLVPAMLRHGRSLEDARDYICSCCYENTIPGREAFHPNGCYLNLPLVLELSLNGGRSLLSDDQLSFAIPCPDSFTDFDSVMSAFVQQLHYVCDCLVALVNFTDRSHIEHRRYPLMSLFIDDCIARGVDVCAGGAHYNMTGCIVAGLPNVVNSLAAIRECCFEKRLLSVTELMASLRDDFIGHEEIQRWLVSAPKWGNGDERVDDLAKAVTDALYSEFCHRTNPRGGRWQVALYSFIANVSLGTAVGASGDGRGAKQALTRNLNPSWGTDREGPTGVLRSLSNIDFTKFPNGSSLDLKFDPKPLLSSEGREKFAGFLKTFVELGVMQVQTSMVDTETLLEAQKRPDRHPHLMVKVAGYSARFVDLSQGEQEELIQRSAQRL